jgi:hypothetical protein
VQSFQFAHVFAKVKRVVSQTLASAFNDVTSLTI